jgi:PmbA protein
MSEDLQGLAGALLAAARKAGAEAADALVVAGESLSVELHNLDLDHAERSEGIDLGLRVLIGRRQASVSASDRSPATIAAMAERAVAMAREAPEDPWAGLADPGELAAARDAAGLEIEDPGPPPDPAALEAEAREAAAGALAVNGVAQVSEAGAGWSRTRLVLAATNGFAGGYARTSRSHFATAISGEGTGMERDDAAESRVFAADLPDPRAVGRRAGERAVAALGAVRPPTGAFPVLFDERVAAGLVGHLVAAINGTAVARGASWLRGAMGEAVLPRGMDLVEEPLRRRGGASRPFDAEGLPTATRALVRDGILRTWTLDLATARQLGLRSTGNATRSPGSPPSPSAGNLRLTPGARSREALIREMGTGLLVTAMIGATINPTTGDYSRGASGFWVEGGEIRRPVNGCTVAGNLRAMLLTLVAADDGREELSRVVPSLLVEGLTVAGR